MKISKNLKKKKQSKKWREVKIWKEKLRDKNLKK